MVSFLLLFLFSFSALSRELVLTNHKAVFLPLGENHQVHIENGEILRVKDLGDQIKISARKIGESQVSVGEKVYQVQVVGKRVFNTYKKLKGLIRPYNLSLEVQGAQLLLRGRLDKIQFLEKLIQDSPLPEKFKWQAEVSKELQPLFIERVESVLHSFGLRNVEILFSPKPFIRLPKEEKKNKKLYQEALSILGLELIETPFLFSQDKLVKIEVLLAEVRKGFSRRYGLKPPSTLQAQVLPNLVWENNENSLLQIQALENKGEAKVLASPTLLSQNGKTASFMAGGEVPIRTGRFSGQLIWKRHGLQLEVTPEVDILNQMKMKIRAEVSSLDFANSVEGLPGLSIHRLENEVFLTEPKEILLSGLIQNNSGREISGLPWLSQIPILGVLFSSRSFQEQQSEFVILLRPSIVKEKELINDPL